jgi:hypothetical protein
VLTKEKQETLKEGDSRKCRRKMGWKVTNRNDVQYSGRSCVKVLGNNNDKNKEEAEEGGTEGN